MDMNTAVETQDDSLYRKIECTVKKIEPQSFSASFGGKIRSSSWLEVSVDSESPVRVLRFSSDYDVQMGDSLTAYISLRSSKERGVKPPRLMGPLELPKEEPVDVKSLTPHQISLRILKERYDPGPSWADIVFNRTDNKLRLAKYEKRRELEKKENPFRVDVIRDGTIIANYWNETWF